MTRQASKKNIIVPRYVKSRSTASQLSAFAPATLPAHPSVDDGGETTKPKQPFLFLLLPSELRNKIYYEVFSAVPPVIDLDPSIFKLLHKLQLFSLFRTSQQLFREATHHFFSTHTFRLFPTYPGRYFETTKPLLARLPADYRASITTLELRLGPGWRNPPRGWVVNDALGLADCNNVRVLKVFVEFDPSQEVFQCFQKHIGFYENFCADLLNSVLKAIPSIKVIEFDAYSSVKRTGDMMSGLGDVVAKFDKVVAWGPERGWDKECDQVWLDAVLLHGGGKLRKSVAVFA